MAETDVSVQPPLEPAPATPVGGVDRHAEAEPIAVKSWKEDERRSLRDEEARRDAAGDKELAEYHRKVDAESSAPLLAPPPPVRPPPPETEVPIDEERAILSAAIPGSEKGARKLRGEAKQLIRSGSALGRFAAQRILSKADRRESELLNHRAKVAFYDTAALCVNVYYNELGKPKPNKVVLDGAMAAMRGAGIVVDSTPLSQDDRAKAVDEAREVSNMEPAELLSRVTQRLAAMRSKPAGAS